MFVIIVPHLLLQDRDLEQLSSHPVVETSSMTKVPKILSKTNPVGCFSSFQLHKMDPVIICNVILVIC